MNRLQTILGVLAILGILAFLVLADPFGLIGKEKYYFATYPTIVPNDPAAWDAKKITSPTVLFDRDEQLFKMWYVGNGIFERSGIGYVTSTDGITWDFNNSNPVFETEAYEPSAISEELAWESGGIRSATVIKDGSSYKMWYSAHKFGGEQLEIGYATSPDGINWSRYSDNPVITFTEPGKWDGHSVGSPSVIKDGSTYKMLYTMYPVTTDGQKSNQTRIGYAESIDGARWKKNDTLAFQPQAEWDTYAVSEPTLFRNDSLLEMWFVGQKKENGSTSIGRAFSKDGLTWAEDLELNPIIQDEDDAFFEPFVGSAGDLYYIWLERYDRKALYPNTLQFSSWPTEDQTNVYYITGKVDPF